MPPSRIVLSFLFFFKDTATTEIYTLSLHDALPICVPRHGAATPVKPCISAGRRSFIWPFYRLISVPGSADVHGIRTGAARILIQATPCPETLGHAAERVMRTAQFEPLCGTWVTVSAAQGLHFPSARFAPAHRYSSTS